MPLPLAALALVLVPQDSKTFTSQHDRFALALLSQVSKQAGNVLLSPYSVAGAFAMAREGAAGDTATEIDAVMHFSPGSTLDTLLRTWPPVVAGSSGRRFSAALTPAPAPAPPITWPVTVRAGASL
jgi:hypothetical protein